MPATTRSMYKTYCSNDCYNTQDKRFEAALQDKIAFVKRIGKDKYEAIRRPLWTELRRLSCQSLQETILMPYLN
jgi:hypothetical protein